MEPAKKETSLIESLFSSTGRSTKPVMLAPLAGVSDHPFRRICAMHGADLTYVEMLSAIAIVHKSRKTYEMMFRHPTESKLGVQLSSRNTDELGQAVAILNRYPFDAIDLNMGCPVRKVVKNGGGSAILKEPERVYQSLKVANANSDVPVSAKIRLGWDHDSKNYLEVADAVAAGGAAWLVVHGRTRSDNYAAPVDLEAIRQIKERVDIPVLANGNLFSEGHAATAQATSGIDGWMLSRGSLGNPWLFNEIKGNQNQVTIDDWCRTVLAHIEWQRDAYQGAPKGLFCMRKHILWYLKGWPSCKSVRDQAVAIDNFDGIIDLIKRFADTTRTNSIGIRDRSSLGSSDLFTWSPTAQMDRTWDRGVES